MNIVLLALGGAEAVAIYGMCMFAVWFVNPLIYGMLDALQPAVGYNWGARNLDRVKRLEMHCFVASAIVSLVSMVFMLAFPQLIAGLFMPKATGELLAEAERALRIVALSLSLRWFVFGAQSFLVNVGDAIPSTIISVASALVFPLALIWLLYPLGLTGMWLVELTNTVLTSILGAYLLLRLRKRVRAMQE